ncbi:unnamed protein product [Peronospora belbahrii]|uniref:H15 domain-containing protein n=1 Tax=Peronospora belbahrii TaxID=622444 RepID=A0AAU9LLG0_9STRA|nr:unnamed protein product [Peronospora belbahrii]CAH0522743.1 unnamed protein product [Peronospora belbahrii]
MPSAPSSKKANTGPGYYDLIKEAVITLKERTGSSRHAIDKFVAAKKGANYSKSRLNIALKRGVESGKLVPVKGSFKLAAEEKKVAGKKPIAKLPVKKALAPVKKAKQPTAKNTSTKAKSASIKKVINSSGKKSLKSVKKPVAKKTSAKKVLTKKPKTTKKKVVKKSAAKKAKSAKN